MEFLVFAGDVISMMDTFVDANFTNKVAHEITKGEIPVIYARGNHEVKGKMAEQFYKFVGAKGEDFYYYFKLDNIYVDFPPGAAHISRTLSPSFISR